MPFVVEVLHGLVVEETVHGFCIGFRVAVIHAPPDIRAPGRHADREQAIDDHGHDRDGDITPVIGPPQIAADQQQLEDRRRDRKQDIEQQDVDALRSALDDTREAAGFFLEVKSKRQRVNVPEGLSRHGTHGIVDRLGRNGVTQLRKTLHQDARDAEGHNEGDRDSHGLYSLAIAAKRIYGRAVEKRKREGRNLGKDEGHHRDDDADLEVQAPVRPQIRHDGFERGDAASSLLGVTGADSGFSGRWRHADALRHHIAHCHKKPGPTLERIRADTGGAPSG